MRVLLDNDVVLDYFLKRSPFLVEAKDIFDRLARKEFEGFVAGITPINVYYFLRKTHDKSFALQSTKDLLLIIEVCTTDKTILMNATTSKITDYEDAVQHACAVAENLDAIVTRNVSDYKNSNIEVFTPSDFLAQLQSQNP